MPADWIGSDKSRQVAEMNSQCMKSMLETVLDSNLAKVEQALSTIDSEKGISKH
jgi:hypothetical protein